MQADLAEFAPYRTNLNHLTIPGRRAGDTRPACEIFNRFVERLEQRTAYAQDLLKSEKFTFDADERVTINRKGLSYPADLDEAKQLWKERLRFEYLQELLGKIGYMMASPLVKLLRTLQAPLLNVGLLMGQLKDKKSKETPA